MTGDAGPAFVSPHKPPPSYTDIESDDAGTDIDYHLIEFAGATWRSRIPAPQAIRMFSVAMSQFRVATPEQRNRSLSELIVRYLHPEDFATMLGKMVDPEDPFGNSELMGLMRKIMTTGTARPFGRQRRSR